MKTRILGRWGLALAVTGLSFVAGSLRGDDSNDASGPVASATPAEVPNDATAALPAAPLEVQLSGGAAEIAKLAQGGLDASVMQAYISNARSKFNLGSDQIVYLNDLGISADVVKAMIERDATIEAANQAYAATSNPPSLPAVDTTPITAPPADSTDTYYPPPTDLANGSTGNDSDYFFNSLQPYGNWFYVAGAGICWQPTVCLGHPDWRPYCDQGRWLDSDCGWYWQSDYSWGWAAFHYGRWFQVANRGWCWAPDRVWGPAWVSWRHSGDYAGWAPLPPTARFVAGAGLVAGSRAVRGGFEFGLSASHYNFIPVARLSDYAPARYTVPPWKTEEVYHNTSLINHFATENGHAVNHSIDPREVAEQARTEIRHVEVRDLAHDAANPTPWDRVSRRGGAMVVYRSQLPAPTPTRVTAPATLRQNAMPGRSYYNLPRTSAEPLHLTAPLYFSGSSPSYRSENYPAGSLVIIGSRNSSVANHLASSGPTYRVFDSSAPGPTHEVRSTVDHQSVYEVPSRSEPVSHSYGDYFRGGEPTAERYAREARGEGHNDARMEALREARNATQNAARPENRGETRTEYHSESSRGESHAAAEHYSSGGGSSSHSSSGSTSSSSSSSSGHH